jgi:hypothetical protein
VDVQEKTKKSKESGLILEQFTNCTSPELAGFLFRQEKGGESYEG